ncbi:hypothetical protein [Lacipirellula sp.]|uniref:hypothetical protein n=1 Tax=Lacipirellula sp. TaxID=2691419 RepID=UPI003D0A4E8C
MRLTINQLAHRLGITADDARRLACYGKIEPPSKDDDGTNRHDADSPKLKELLSLTPAELTARGIINTSLLFKKEN